jgi:histidine triad (HIT) family protein
MASIFSKIVKGEIPCYKIAESEDYLAFLDVLPLKKGHVIVIPKKEVDYIFDLDDTLYEGLMTFSKKVARALKTAVPCKRVTMHVIGLEVPHTHVHLVPTNTINDCTFTGERLKFTQEEFEQTATAISAHF